MRQNLPVNGNINLQTVKETLSHVAKCEAVFIKKSNSKTVEKNNVKILSTYHITTQVISLRS